MEKLIGHWPELNEFKTHISDIVSYEETAASSDEGKEKLVLQVEWKKIANEFGDVEVSIYRRKDNPSKNAIFYLPGLQGDTGTFKDKYLCELMQRENADVILVHRNGVIFNKNAVAISSPQRSEKATQTGQDSLGGEDKPYGYKEWVAEFACAAKGVGDNYDHIKVIGHSLGGLIGIESLRLLKENKVPVLSKIDTMLSLSGQIGKPQKDEKGQVWIDPYRNYSIESHAKKHTELIEWSTSFIDLLRKTQQAGGIKMKDPDEIVREYLQIMENIYAENDNIPPSVKIVQVMPLSEQYFGPYQGRELRRRQREGQVNFTFVNDTRAKGKPSERHGITITTEEMNKLLHIADKKGGSNIKVLSTKGVEDASIDAVARGIRENKKM